MLQRIIAFLLLILLSPLLLLFYVLVKLTSTGPFLFTQLRAGKDTDPFTIYKIRTMIPDAEQQKKKYKALNEASGPVFKIHDDPRYTWFGKILSHTGLDELPQLINIIRGEMAFVGPRPLPIEEATAIPKQYRGRFDVLPGITSPWVVSGSHELSFEKWMGLDVWYVKNRSWWIDIKIILATVLLISKISLTMIVKGYNKIFLF